MEKRKYHVHMEKVLHYSETEVVRVPKELGYTLKCYTNVVTGVANKI